MPHRRSPVRGKGVLAGKIGDPLIIGRELLKEALLYTAVIEDLKEFLVFGLAHLTNRNISASGYNGYVLNHHRDECLVTKPFAVEP